MKTWKDKPIFVLVIIIIGVVTINAALLALGIWIVLSMLRAFGVI